MATLNPISASLRFTLDLGVIDGKATEKSVTINNIKTGADAANLLAFAKAFAGLLEHPVTMYRKFDTGELKA